MIIGIDGNEANITNRVGVNKYAYEIIWGMYNLLQSETDPISITVYLKNKPLTDMPSETSKFRYKILSGGKVWILTRLVPELLFGGKKPDVFFSPSHYVPIISIVPEVCSIMDLGYLEFSAQFKKYDYWQLRLWTAWSIKVSKYVMTISNATKKDIVRLYPDSKEKIVVTHPGYDKDLTTKNISESQIDVVKNKYTIVSDYILYLGTLKPSKNIEGLINAFAKIHDTSNLQLVIAGKKGWLYESIFKLVGELNLDSKVIFTDFVEEKDKAALIKGSRIFILPSYWEGFGIDVLTAFVLGVPVISSNVGSLPEVMGDAGIQIEPKSSESITNAIEKILKMNRKQLDEFLKKEYNRLDSFSWEAASRRTLATLKKAYDEKNN